MANKSIPNGYILGLDVGDKRIGTAVVSTIAKLPRPLQIIQAGETAYSQIKELALKEGATLIVVGIPRNLDGAETAQSQKIRDFATGLSGAVNIPIEFADESLSTKRAEELIKHPEFKNSAPDSLAACFILEEFLGSINTVNGESS